MSASPGEGCAVRLGIDGPVAGDAAELADAVSQVLAERAVPVAHVSATDFLRARSLRLESGADDPDAYFEGWYDWAALRREVLDPLGPGGSGQWLPRLRDPVGDRPYREPRREAPPGLVAVVVGRFLGRWELSGAFDVLVFLDVSPAALERRLPDEDRRRVSAAWARYLQECDPASRAHLVVRFDHPRRPAVRESAPGSA